MRDRETLIRQLEKSARLKGNTLASRSHHIVD
jgi:hypothetical protein